MSTSTFGSSILGLPPDETKVQGRVGHVDQVRDGAELVAAPPLDPVAVDDPQQEDQHLRLGHVPGDAGPGAGAEGEHQEGIGLKGHEEKVVRASTNFYPFRFE